MNSLGEVGFARGDGNYLSRWNDANARALGLLLGSTPKGVISLPAIGTWEEERFVNARDERLVGMALEASRASLYKGKKQAVGG